ncbi:MAG: hypothetical protein ACFFCS_07720 [Candidatus Hodarchaeota archaeon]
MTTEISIVGEKFLINGKPTYEGKSYKGKSIEGLLFNSRMIQAVFDDENPETRDCWKYPDTGEWDPDRNTDEFCAMLPEYKRHGMLAFTVGLQGGGSIYTPEIYDNYDNSAFTPDGKLKEAYFERLDRILKIADDIGMIVIVNYFYWQHARRFKDKNIIKDVTTKTTDRLLETGHENILVDIVNESAGIWEAKGIDLCAPEHVHELIDVVRGRNIDGRRLLLGVSSSGGLLSLPYGKWLEKEDFSMPHGNGCTPEILKMKIQAIRDEEEYKKRPRPILVNEDSIFVENLEAAVEEHASWGFYCQGYGSNYRDRMNWKNREREGTFEELSGYQTVPVNWSINTKIKRAFFDKLKEITM